MRAKRWVIASPDTERVRVLSRETGYTPLTAAVLSARGIDTPQAAADYLSCDVRGLHDPFGLTDMDKAVEVVREVIDRGEKMVVYGDYDVDGITATCTLVDYLRSKGAKCEYYIPNRLTDGYGLTRPAMEQLYEQGTRLLITVDSGITANEEIAVARELGMQVVITDHHECHENLPDAQAVVDCKRTDDTYPFSSLAGVGVAFKLICALEGDTLSMLDRYADLVALGTVADVMPIVGENRIIVAEGLKKLSVTANIGLEMPSLPPSCSSPRTRYGHRRLPLSFASKTSCARTRRTRYSSRRSRACAANTTRLRIRSSCWPERAGIRALSASCARGCATATAVRSCSSRWTRTA